MPNPTNLLMFTLIIMSLMLMASSSSPFMMWISLEINTISFIALMFLPSNQESSESCMIYFLPQSVGSSLFLMSSSTPAVFSTPFLPLIITLSMALKLGMAPFHYWFIKTAKNISWKMNSILMTIQKIPPFMVIIMNTPHPQTKMILILLSAMVGPFGGINQTNIKSLLAFSSVSHMAWMMAALYIDNLSWLIYLTVYSTIFMAISLTLNKKISSINQMISVNPNMKLTFFLLILSLGGMPPLTGFFQKWMVITLLSSPLVIFTLMLSAVLNLYFYIRLSLPILLTNNSSNPWMKKNFHMNILTIPSLFLLPFLLLFFPIL
uniref:NADH-ubiquinone oxidoreductase chain 2 n=1 Tax=Damon diadema TaxID=317680 RepID=B5U6L2_9ARAC|nr:NADH dehydrogenase subunit 2 [Damon diadema]ACI02280.1 NADH dehydrogenase subunit 2 [Damon diadema]